MQAEILMIGTELLLGQIVDTNAAFMGHVLAENGIDLYQKTTVGDNADRIRRALDGALTRSDVVLTSGGLGPTEDDITRECVAELLGKPLEYREDLYQDLVAIFERSQYAMSENNRKQAYAPAGAMAIHNPNGTAPGLIVESERGVVICMPGVPGELKAMLTDSVVPYLRAKYSIAGLLHSRVLRVCGLGESRVDAAIGDLIRNQQNPTVGVLASPEAVRIRITAKAATIAEADALIDPVDAQVRDRLPGNVMDAADETVEQAVERLLAARRWRLAVAETATGGAICQKLTACGHDSFAGGRIFPPGTVDGAVARDLAEQLRASTGAECGLAFVADLAQRSNHVVFVTPDGAWDWELGHAGTTPRAQIRAAIGALEGVRRRLSGAVE